MKHIRIFPLFIAGYLAACGGGGGSGGDVSTPPAVPPVAVPPESGTAAIVVPDGFDFATHKDIRVEVSKQGEVPTRTYLTVCLDRPGTADPDLRRCILKTPVGGGKFATSLALPNDVAALTATLWSFNPAGPLQSTRWARGALNETLRIE